MTPALQNVCVVLYEPQDDINIGNTVRACKNFGITDIRLVRPADGEPRRISISAPKADDIIDDLGRFDTLDDALADCVSVVGMTARSRKASWVVTEPRGAAISIVEDAGEGAVALLFGREDHGLPNDALDRCDTVVTIPTNPDYSSLNLGQAVLLMCWETFRVAEGVTTEVAESVRPDSEHPPADREQMELMFGQAERSLDVIEFFKSGNSEHVMRSVRSVLQRADLDQRELAIWFGIFKEIQAFVRRHGIEP